MKHLTPADTVTLLDFFMLLLCALSRALTGRAVLPPRACHWRAAPALTRHETARCVLLVGLLI
jgi:hypothetical protein